MSRAVENTRIRELSLDELPLILPLIEQHNAKIAPEELRRRLDAMIPHGYHCIAAFLEDRVVGVAGYWLGTRFWCGEYMDVDNVVVDETLRSRGIGDQLMTWLETKAKELGCQCVVLDSYVSLDRAHRFYFRRGYHIPGFHFYKAVT